MTKSTSTPTALLSAAAQAMIDKATAERNAVRADVAGIEELLGEKPKQPAALSTAPASTSVVAPLPVPKARYTPQALIDLMVEHPAYTHKQFAAHFGYPPSWFAAILSSDRFQQEFESRRHEVSNPMLTGTLEDMYRALTVQSLAVMQEKLNSPAASEALILKSAELGIKALAVKKAEADPGAGAVGNVAKLADRLLAMMPKQALPQTPARDFTIEASLNELPK